MKRYSRIKRLASVLLVAAIWVCLFAGSCCASAEEQQLLDAALPWLERNPDTIGWLKVGKIIDTPVVQRDNAFYLEHNYSGEKSSGGMVFLDEECSILPQDEHLVLYGHNMRNGTVFGELDRYRDLAYLKANSIITFDTIYQEGKYVVIAVYDMSAETEDPHFMQMLNFNFLDNEYFMTFVHQAQGRSFYKIPVDVRHGDHLLSLITCSYTLYDGRLILMCRKLREDEDPEEIAEAMQATEFK